MKWTGLMAALLCAAVPVAAQQSSPSQASPDASARQAQAGGSDSRAITLQGCVRPAIDKDQVIVTDVTESLQAGRSAMPNEAHGRKVIFWLDRDDPLKPHVGHMVEVSGMLNGIEKSEAELKAGRQKDGGLVVEFEGPGKDVTASNAVVGQALGTSGRTSAETDDVKTFLMRVKVNTVKPIAGNCPPAGQ